MSDADRELALEYFRTLQAEIDLRITNHSYQTVLLNERRAIVDSPYIVEWSQPFTQRFAVPKGQVPTPAQRDTYNHSREYTVPVFNRGQRLPFTYLCINPTTDTPPNVFVSTLYPGGTVRWQPVSSLVLDVPVQVAIVRGLIATVLVVLASGVFPSNAWFATGVGAAIGLSAQLVGALEYKAERCLALRGLVRPQRAFVFQWR